MITEDYVSFEIAKLLKEKGFDEFTDECYVDNEEWVGPTSRKNSELDDNHISRPTLQMAMKWLREVHGIQIEITIVGTEAWENPSKWCYGWRIQNTKEIWRHSTDYGTYEESCESAIKYCLENLI